MLIDATISLTPELDAALQAATRAWRRQDFAQAKQSLDHATRLADEAKSIYGRLAVKHLLAIIAYNECDDLLSRALHEEVMAESEAIGFLGGVVSSLHHLAFLALAQGDENEASAHFAESIRRSQQAGEAATALMAQTALEEYVLQRKAVPLWRGATQACR